MMQTRRLVIAGLGAAGLAQRAAAAPSATRLLPGRPQPMPVKASGVSPAALAAAQAYSDQLGGLALLVWQGGALRYERYAAGTGPDTRLTTFSMAKPVLAMAYGLAIQAGAIKSLDEPVGRYVPEWGNDARGGITLRQLLTMRSGLKLYSLGRSDPQALEMASGTRATETALATPLDDVPGAVFNYANVNSQIAGLALQRALAAKGLPPYDRFLSQRLWKPLGQSDATLEVESPTGSPRFFAGLGATGRDWVRLGALLNHDGRWQGRQVLPRGWVGAMATPSPEPHYGLQMWIGHPWSPRRGYGRDNAATVPWAEPYHATDMLLFDGAGGQRVYASKTLDLVIVRVGKSNWAWEDSVLPNTIIKGLNA
jgi:CubicO group peptidase (beta-lactamase class C family)